MCDWVGEILGSLDFSWSQEETTCIENVSYISERKDGKDYRTGTVQFQFYSDREGKPSHAGQD